MSLPNIDLLTILGPTASGKTPLAAHLAHQLGGEVISADSRQVYKGMDIGTGKDYDDYQVGNDHVKAHLIDIVDAGYEYNIFEYQEDFMKVFNKLKGEGKIPILCGGSGMYIEAVTNGYKFLKVPANPELREKLKEKPKGQLISMLSSMKTLHNVSDITNHKRLIRAIEVAQFSKDNKTDEIEFPKLNTLIFGVKFERRVTRQRITERLEKRMEEGMIKEVELLLEKGISKEKLVYYGLEYKFIAFHLTGELTYDEMFGKLNTAIHQFAKRQMTWFRKMERQGARINWIEGLLPMDEKINKIKIVLEKIK